MKVAFLTETQYRGKWPIDFPNARTEVAWQIALDATHYPIHQYADVSGFDAIMVIFPKGRVFLSAEGSKIVDGVNPVSGLLASDFINVLKKNNKKVFYVQEGPHWWFNDYELPDQIRFYNMISECDGIFAHNKIDADYYSGMFPNTTVNVIYTLMIEDGIKDIIPSNERKVIIGGNCARWYGGFESYMVAQEFKCGIYGQTSHAMRRGEEQLFTHLPRLMWNDWMKELSKFRYAVHLMPTVAAGTFSLNCAYFGIPCIGNEEVDTQRICFPSLSVNVNDVGKARELAQKLYSDEDFYKYCSEYAEHMYSVNYTKEIWLHNIMSKLI